MGIKNNTHNKGATEYQGGEQKMAHQPLWVLKRIPIFEKTNTRLHMTTSHRSIVPDEENPIGAIFTQFPELNGRQIARAMNINETLFQNYINGRKRPSFERLRDIENYLHTLGEALSRVRF